MLNLLTILNICSIIEVHLVKRGQRNGRVDVKTYAIPNDT